MKLPGFTSGFRKTRFFKKPNPVGFLGFYWVLGFYSVFGQAEKIGKIVQKL